MGVNNQPREIVSTSGTIYVGDIGQHFPSPHVTPNTSHWTPIGADGDLNYMRDGITVTMDQALSTWRSLGSSQPRKLFRTEESLSVRATVADISPTMMAFLVDNAVTGTGSNPRKLPMSRNYDLKKMAVLCRLSQSPIHHNGHLQLEIPEAVVTSSPEPVFRGGDEPAPMLVELQALIDPNAGHKDERFGRYVVSTPYPTTRFGISVNDSISQSELSSLGTQGAGTISAYSGNRYIGVARAADEDDIEYIFYTSASNPNHNRIGDYSKQAGTVTHSGTVYNVWVTDSPETHGSALDIRVA